MQPPAFMPGEITRPSQISTTHTSTPSSGALLKSGRDIFWYAALAGVLMVLLHESLFQGKGLVPADAILKFSPWNRTIRPSNFLLADQYWTLIPTLEFVHQQKNFPLWNPYICCGAPNLGAISGALLFPIRLLLSWLDPFSASGPAAFLKLWLAGSFTMIYVRLLGVSRPAAFLAGLVFCLSGFMIVWLGHPQVNCAMWLPLLLYLMEKSFRLGTTNAAAGPMLRVWACFAVVFACMILGGHPPTTIHITMVVLIYFLFRLMEHRRERVLQRVILCWLAASCCRVDAGSAPDSPVSGILPVKLQYRSPGPVETMGIPTLASPRSFIFCCPMSWAILPWGLRTCPNLLGIGPMLDNFIERTGYVGILPLFIAACGMALRPCKFTKFFFLLAIGSMLVIFGVPPFSSLMRMFPILRDVDQTRLLLIVGFSVAVLAGFGWDALFNRLRDQRRTLIVTVGFCAIVGMALLCFWIVTGPKLATLDSSHRSFLMRQFLILGGGMTVAVVLALWPAHWKGWMPMAIGLSWTAADLLCFATGYNPSISRDLYYPRTPAIEWLQKDDSLFRVFGGGTMLPPNTGEVFGLSDARGCDFLTVRRYQELITGKADEFFFYRNPESIPSVFPLLNVKYIFGEKPLPLNPLLFDLVYSKEILIYHYKACRERALLVFNEQVEPDPAAVLARVSSGNFDPRQVVLLEDQPPPAKMATSDQPAGTNATGSVHITSYEPDDVRIDASLPQPGFLLLLDTWFPGWLATVNSEAAPIPSGRTTIFARSRSRREHQPFVFPIVRRV